MNKSKKKEYTPMEKAFLLALADESNLGDIKRCMQIAGYSPNTSVGVIINQLHEEISEVASKIIAANSTKAALGIIGVLNDPATLNAKNTLAAAKEVLDRAGVAKKQEQETKGQEGGIVILPAKGSRVKVEINNDDESEE